jgi:hypothetical protein
MKCSCYWPQVVARNDRGKPVCLCGGEVEGAADAYAVAAERVAAERVYVDVLKRELAKRGTVIEAESGGEVGHMPWWKYWPWRLLWRLGIKLGTRPREL